MMDLDADLLKLARSGIGAATLVRELIAQGYRRREVNRALQSALERGKIRLNADMQLEAREATQQRVLLTFYKRRKL
jgi:hypothetical protein